MFVVYTAMVDDSARFLLIPGKLTSNLTNAVAMARTPSIASHTNISYVSYSLDPSAFDITIRRTTNGNQHEKGAGESVCKSWNEVFFPVFTVQTCREEIGIYIQILLLF